MQSVIAARIDSLSPKRKTLLQIASVIGSDIPIILLREVVDLRVRTAEAAGGAQGGAVPLRDAKPDICAIEIQARLVHEIAYGSLISAKRQMLHGRVLRGMESQFRDSTLDVVESLAHHAFNAALWDEALTYLCQAGDKAVEFSAYQAAGAFFESALQALTHLPQNEERIRQGIDIRLKLRSVFAAIADYDRLERCLVDAETLASSLGDQRRSAAIDVARAFVHNGRGELDASIERGSRARHIGRTLGDFGLEVSATFYLGASLHVAR